MTRKSTPPAGLLILMIVGLSVWQCGCIRTQPASTQAAEESREESPEESPNDDPFGGGSGDPSTVVPAKPAPPKPGVLFYPATRGARPGTAKAIIKRALEEPISLDLADKPLEDVAALLRDKCGINVAIDRLVLHEIGLKTSDVQITIRVDDVPLRSALQGMLREPDLTWMIRYDALLITTPEEAEEHLVTRVYDVADLVTFREENGRLWEDHLTLEDTITEIVEPVRWDVVGGSGTVYGVTLGRAKVLVVSQTEQIHRQVVELLEKLRTAARNNPDNGHPPFKKRRSQQRKSPMIIGGPIPVVG